MSTLILRELDAPGLISDWQASYNSVAIESGFAPRAIYVSATDETNYCNLLAGSRQEYGAEGDYPRFNGVPLIRVVRWPVGTLGFLCSKPLSEAEMVDGEPVWSARNQRRAYDALRAREDAKR